MLELLLGLGIIVGALVALLVLIFGTSSLYWRFKAHVWIPRNRFGGDIDWEAWVGAGLAIGGGSAFFGFLSWFIGNAILNS